MMMYKAFLWFYGTVGYFYQMVTMEMNLCMFELGITIHRRDESQIKKKRTLKYKTKRLWLLYRGR